MWPKSIWNSEETFNEILRIIVRVRVEIVIKTTKVSDHSRDIMLKVMKFINISVFLRYILMKIMRFRVSFLIKTKKMFENVVDVHSFLKQGLCYPDIYVDILYPNIHCSFEKIDIIHFHNCMHMLSSHFFTHQLSWHIFHPYIHCSFEYANIRF